MTTEDKLTVALAALKEIRSLKEEDYGDHYAKSLALNTNEVHDIIDQAFCFCLPIEEVQRELSEQGIYNEGLKAWATGRLAEIKNKTK